MSGHAASGASTLSTHVLDAVSGDPAAGMQVSLARRAEDPAGSWAPLGAGVTDSDGRINRLAEGLRPGVHRLVFDTDGYAATAGISCFYPEVAISFRVTTERHYHVPLLLSPFAYSTYRGS